VDSQVSIDVEKNAATCQLEDDKYKSDKSINSFGNMAKAIGKAGTSRFSPIFALFWVIQGT
jgi:hypothetical protein